MNLDAIKIALLTLQIGVLQVQIAEAHQEPVVIAQATQNTIGIELASISDCESGVRDKYGKAIKGSARQFDEKGKVIKHFNSNGTVDKGKFQINSIHEKEASKLGFDLNTLEGNNGFANYLYEQQGTKPWNSSRGCWYVAGGKEELA